MIRNVGPIDRTTRVILGLVLITLALTVLPTLVGFLGLGLLVTGLVGWCPVYQLIGREPLVPSTKHPK